MAECTLWVVLYKKADEGEDRSFSHWAMKEWAWAKPSRPARCQRAKTSAQGRDSGRSEENFCDGKLRNGLIVIHNGTSARPAHMNGYR